MKKTLVLSLCAVAASLSVYAQGTFQALNLDTRAVDSPGGAQVGAGNTGQWYAGADAGSLAPVGAETAILAAGLVSAGVVTVDGIAGGADAAVRLDVWNDEIGVPGQSDVGSVTLAGGIDIPQRPSGLGVEIVVPIPEPSTIALAVFGGAALFFARRRK